MEADEEPEISLRNERSRVRRAAGVRSAGRFEDAIAQLRAVLPVRRRRIRTSARATAEGGVGCAFEREADIVEHMLLSLSPDP